MSEEARGTSPSAGRPGYSTGSLAEGRKGSYLIRVPRRAAPRRRPIGSYIGNNSEAQGLGRRRETLSGAATRANCGDRAESRAGHQIIRQVTLPLPPPMHPGPAGSPAARGCSGAGASERERGINSLNHDIFPARSANLWRQKADRESCLVNRSGQSSLWPRESLRGRGDSDSDPCGRGRRGRQRQLMQPMS